MARLLPGLAPARGLGNGAGEKKQKKTQTSLNRDFFRKHAATRHRSPVREGNFLPTFLNFFLG
jgi:hypothetical protein